jgi:benzoyl-CoA reductase subunit C
MGAPLMTTTQATPEVLRIVQRCEALFEDLHFNAVKDWKAAKPGRKAIGYMPVYVPREIVHAAGMLPVGILGGGDQIEVIQGDAYYQSYICRIPRSTIELGLTGRLDCLDGMLFPSICDVIRNLSGMWQILFPTKYVRYVDVPQNYDDAVGGKFYIEEMQHIRDDLGKLRGAPITDAELNASIAAYNDNRAALRDLYAYRAAKPWQAPTSEVYLVQRAGMVLPVEEHTALVRQYLAAAEKLSRPKRDNARVVLTGGFCEQPATWSTTTSCWWAAGCSTTCPPTATRWPNSRRPSCTDRPPPRRSTKRRARKRASS